MDDVDWGVDRAAVDRLGNRSGAAASCPEQKQSLGIATLGASLAVGTRVQGGSVQQRGTEGRRWLEEMEEDEQEEVQAGRTREEKDKQDGPGGGGVAASDVRA